MVYGEGERKNMSETRTMQSNAFKLHAGGYCVIPVGKDKKPLIATWKSYQHKLPTDEEVLKWWKKWPNANIGIVTGKISGITVVDVDVYKGGSISKFPNTFTVKTGNGGYHLYYKYQPGFTVSASAYPDLPFTDIRGDGGYVVGPYSTTDYEDKDGKRVGGAYEVINNIPLSPFPLRLFPKTKLKRTLSSTIGVTSGSRNDSIASFIGKLLQSSQESEWESEVWPAVERANATYKPPLPPKELRTTFDSIVKKDLARRAALIVSPIQIDDGDEVVDVKMRKNKGGVPYKDMANVLAILKEHPYYKGTIKYNTFRQEIEYNGKPFEDRELVKIQYFMQTKAELHGVSKDVVYDAIVHYAHQNSYDEAQEWLKALKWDQKPRLFSWLSVAPGVPDDTYHQGVGAQWFMGMIKRIMLPGSIFDYMLVVVGPQGIGKTSLFRILGGPWYKSYTGAIDNKDFYLALRGAMIVDLDEGAALYRSEAIKIKSVITDTHDEYRAPYDRTMKKYPRRFVFSMSTNDTEPFRDVTGNRRYWTVDTDAQINFEWLQGNREQLFAEAYHYFKTDTKLPEVPLGEASEKQDLHLPEDTWTEMVVDEVRKSSAYCKGDINFQTTIIEVFQKLFAFESLARMTKGQEMRIAIIFRKELGMEKRRIRGEDGQKMRWMLTPKKAKELQANNATQVYDIMHDESE